MRQQHDLKVNMSQRNAISRGRVVGGGQAPPNMAFGKANRPQTPVGGIIRNNYGEEGELIQHAKYQEFMAMVSAKTPIQSFLFWPILTVTTTFINGLKFECLPIISFVYYRNLRARVRSTFAWPMLRCTLMRLLDRRTSPCMRLRLSSSWNVSKTWTLGLQLNAATKATWWMRAASHPQVMSTRTSELLLPKQWLGSEQTKCLSTL